MMAIEVPRLTSDLWEIARGINNRTSGAASIVSVNDIGAASQAANVWTELDRGGTIRPLRRPAGPSLWCQPYPVCGPVR